MTRRRRHPPPVKWLLPFMDKKVRGRTAHLTREMVTVGIAMRSQWHKHTLGSQCTEGNPWRDEKGGKWIRQLVAAAASLTKIRSGLGLFKKRQILVPTRDVCSHCI